MTQRSILLQVEKSCVLRADALPCLYASAARSRCSCAPSSGTVSLVRVGNGVPEVAMFLDRCFQGSVGCFLVMGGGFRGWGFRSLMVVPFFALIRYTSSNSVSSRVEIDRNGRAQSWGGVRSLSTRCSMDRVSYFDDETLLRGMDRLGSSNGSKFSDARRSWRWLERNTPSRFRPAWGGRAVFCCWRSC